MLGVNAVSHVQTAPPDYREALVSDQRPLSLDPLVGATDPTVRDVGELLYRRLFSLDGTGMPRPDLAAGYQASPDGLTYIVPLRAGQQWSDGKPITITDVVTTVRFVQSAMFGDPVTAAPWQDVHVTATSVGVTFDLAAPRASFPALLTQLPILPIGALSSARLSHLQTTAAVPMPTSGAFRVAGAGAAAIDLLPNQHSEARPRLNQVQLDLFSTFAAAAAAFRAGAVDGVLAGDPVQRDQLVAAGGHSHEITTFRFVDLVFNQRSAPLGDPVVREAIATAVDRQTLVDGPLAGLAVAQAGPFPAGIAWVQQPPPAATPAPAVAVPGAQTTLSAAGWVPGPDGVRRHGTTRLALRLAVANATPLPALATAVAVQLAAIGAEVSVTTMPPAALRAIFSTAHPDFDMALADWDNGPDPDVSSFWRSTATPPSGVNVSGGPADPFLDQAIDRLATLTDQQARTTAATAVSSQLAADLPAVFIETPQVALVVRRGISVLVPAIGDSGARWLDIAAWHRG